MRQKVKGKGEGGEHYRYLTAFKAFDAVVTFCFGYGLDPCYMTYLKDSENAWFDFNFNMIPKLHILLKHLPEELQQTGEHAENPCKKHVFFGSIMNILI